MFFGSRFGASHKYDLDYFRQGCHTPWQDSLNIGNGLRKYIAIPFVTALSHFRRPNAFELHDVYLHPVDAAEHLFCEDEVLEHLRELSKGKVVPR